MSNIIGLGLALIGIVGINVLLSRCVQYFTGSTQPRAQRSGFAALTSKQTLFERTGHLFSKTVLYPTTFYHQSSFPKKFSSEAYTRVANKLTTSYPYLIDTVSDGNCGPMALLAILVLKAQEREDTRQEIFKILNQQHTYTLPNIADAAFFDIERLNKGLGYLKALFSHPPSYLDFKGQLNYDSYLSETVLLAFRFVCYQLHVANNRQLDINDFIRSNKNNKPKTWLHHYLILSTFELFHLSDIPMYAMTEDTKVKVGKNEVIPSTIWEESNLQGDLSSQFCIILNGDHYQFLAKENPDIRDTENSPSQSHTPKAQPWVNRPFTPTQPPQESTEQRRSRLTKTLENPQATTFERNQAIRDLRQIYWDPYTPMEVKRTIAMTVGTHKQNCHLNINGAASFFGLSPNTQAQAFDNLLA